MSESSNVVHLTSANFEAEVLQSPIPVFVDFWAAWCGPCRMVGPIVEELANEYAGRIRVAKYDVDGDPAIPARMGIQSIPTMLFFRDGKVVDGMVGAAPKAALQERFDAVLGS